MAKYKVTTAPANEIWTSSDQEVLDHLKLVSPSDTDLIDHYIKAARQWIELHLGRALVNQTITEYFDEFPLNEFIPVRFAPLVSVTSVKYYDEDNSLQTWASSNYTVDTYSADPGVELGVDKTFPDTEDKKNAIEVIYVAGYGSAATDVPDAIRQAALLILAEMYENRENTIKRLPTAAEYLLNPYRRFRF